MYDIDKEKYEERKQRTELENFLSDNGHKPVLLATSAGVFEGTVVFHLKNDKDNVVDLEGCNCVSINNKRVSKLRIKLDAVMAWGEL